MKNVIQSNISFLEWTKSVNTKNPGILEHIMKSTDQLDRVIAKQIMQAAGVGKSD
jgi:hypothetical protein